jgi:hypothetical protein
MPPLTHLKNFRRAKRRPVGKTQKQEEKNISKKKPTTPEIFWFVVIVLEWVSGCCDVDGDVMSVFFLGIFCGDHRE